MHTYTVCSYSAMRSQTGFHNIVAQVVNETWLFLRSAFLKSGLLLPRAFNLGTGHINPQDKHGTPIWLCIFS